MTMGTRTGFALFAVLSTGDTMCINNAAAMCPSGARTYQLILVDVTLADGTPAASERIDWNESGDIQSTIDQGGMRAHASGQIYFSK